MHLLARSREQLPEERLIDALSRVKGAFSLVMLTDDALIAARDPHGFRPLSLGRLDGALGGRERDLRARPDRRDATSATSSPARWW